MIIAIVFAHVWGVVQVIILGSLARTSRVRTVFTAMAVGLYACAPLALLLQLAWTRPAAWLTGASVHNMVETAAYTADPFIEEFVKVLPIAALLLIPLIRRQWSVTDCVLIGAASGSGFGLAEALFRYGASPQHARAVDQGWILGTGIAFPTVPSLWTTLTSWLPAGSAPFDDYITHGRSLLNLHLAWSAIGGLAIGLIVLRRGWLTRTVAAVLLLYIGIDHASFNAEVSGNAWAGAAQFRGLRNLLWLMPLAALAIAWWFDRQHDGGANEPTLAAEQGSSFRLLGTLKASVRWFPWSLSPVSSFVRLRRAYNAERAAGFAEKQDNLGAMIIQARDQIDEMQSSGSRSTALLGLSQRRGVIVRFVLMAPPLVWFVFGGWPQTAWLQMTMVAPLVWKLVLVLSVLSQVWIAGQVISHLRSLSKTPKLSIADDAAVLAMRIACGVGAIGFGGYALSRSFAGLSPSLSLTDIQEAFHQAALATSIQLANLATAAMPSAVDESSHSHDESSHPHKEKAVDWWMNKWFGTHTDPGFLRIHQDDGTGMKLARAGGVLVTLPIWGVGLFVSNAVDEIRFGGPFHFWG